MKKVGIITQARMASTRLPGKIMLPILGKPLLSYFVERLEKSGVPLYIATSDDSSNDVVEKFAEENNILYFRGDENNVLKRYYDTAKKFDIDVIVRITSDCPLIDGEMIRDAVKQYLEWNDDNIHFSNVVERTYPHGLNFEIFSLALLEDAYKNAKTDFEKEHVTPYIIKNVSGKVILKHFVREKDASHCRVTVDTKEDFALVKKLIEECRAHTKNTEEIIEIFETHKELADMNTPTKEHVWTNKK